MTDNHTVMHILSRGSINYMLQSFVWQSMLKLRYYGISIDPVWVSRDIEITKYAYLVSRDFNKDNISINCETFQQVVKYFGDYIGLLDPPK